MIGHLGSNACQGRIRWACRVAGLVVAALGGAKLYFGYQRQFLVPAWVFYGVACMEVVCGALIVSSKLRTGGAGLIGLGAAGIASDWMLPEGDCGCLAGVTEFAESTHIIFAGSVGCVGSLLVLASTWTE